MLLIKIWHFSSSWCFLRVSSTKSYRWWKCCSFISMMCNDQMHSKPDIIWWAFIGFFFFSNYISKALGICTFAVWTFNFFIFWYLICQFLICIVQLSLGQVNWYSFGWKLTEWCSPGAPLIAPVTGDTGFVSPGCQYCPAKLLPWIASLAVAG